MSELGGNHDQVIHNPETIRSGSALSVDISQFDQNNEVFSMSEPNSGARRVISELPETSVSAYSVDQNQLAELSQPLSILDETESLEKHLEIKTSKQGQSELAVKQEVINSRITTIISDNSPENLNRKIQGKYLEAIQTAAESEPARKEALTEIEQRIHTVINDLNLPNINASSNFETVNKAKNLANLTPHQRQSLKDLKNLFQCRESLNLSSLNNVEKRYENFLERSGQKELLMRFRQHKSLLETMPFQDWMSESGKLANRQSAINKEDNPFNSYSKAIDVLHQRPPNTGLAEIYFKNALSAADKIDVKEINSEIERVKKEIKTEQEKNKPDPFTIGILKSEQRALILLKASPGLLRIAHADYLLQSGNPDGAFRQLVAAADNPVAIAIVNKNNRYYEQLVDRSLHGNKDMIYKANQAAINLQEYQDHFQRALSLVKSGDKQKAKEEFEKADRAANSAESMSHNLDSRDLGLNVKSLDNAIRDERRKPIDQQNREKLQALEEQRKYYQTLLHVPALSALAKASTEFCLSFSDNTRNTDRDESIRNFIARAKQDPNLFDIRGVKEQLDSIDQIVHQQSWGEMTWNYLRQNSGSIAALGVGFTVAGLTCWSGPGAALAGSAAAAAVAGTTVDWASGNEVSLASFGGHCLEGGGAGLGRMVVGRLSTNVAISRLPKQLGVPVIGATSAGTTGALEHLPELFLEGPTHYISRVGLDIAAGAVFNGPRTFFSKKLPPVKHIIQSPGFSHIIKAPAEGILMSKPQPK